MKCILLLSLIFSCTLLPAQPLVQIRGQQLYASLGKYGYTRTGDSFLAFDNFSGNWKASGSDKIYWQPYATQWFYCRVANEAPADRSMKLWLHNVQAGITQLYLVTNGKIDSTFKTGSLLTAAERSTTDRLLSLPVVLKAGTVTELYLKSYRRQIGITLTPVLTDALHGHANKLLDYWMIFGLSLMLIISIAALSLYFYFPSRELAWFAAYSIAVLLYSIAVSGFGSLYLWGGLPWFEENAAVFLGALATATLFQLSRLLFNTGTFYKKTDRFLNLFTITNVVVAMLGFNLLINYFSAYTYGLLLLLLYLLQIAGYCIIFILALIAALRRQQKEFGMIAIMFGVILAVVCILILQETGVLSFDYRFHSYMIAFSLFPQTLIPLLFFINRIRRQLQQRGEQIIQERIKAESKILKERIRLGQELHDDIGSTMSGIKLYSHLAAGQLQIADAPGLQYSLQTIQQTTEEMILRINDQVWLMQNEEQTLEEVLQRLVEYAGKMAWSKNMELNATIATDISGMDGVADYKNLYLFCKEAINNAVKYSGGSRLQLAVKEQNGQLVIVIADNGCGFDINNAKEGNGLKNMQQRANAMKADLQITSKPGEGTVLTLVKESLDGV